MVECSSRVFWRKNVVTKIDGKFRLGYERNEIWNVIEDHIRKRNISKPVRDSGFSLRFCIETNTFQFRESSKDNILFFLEREEYPYDD